MGNLRNFVVSGVLFAAAAACSSGTDATSTVGRRAQADTTDGGTTCAHPLCSVGVGLDKTCDPCAALLCSEDPYCCGSAWDTTCVGEVTSICQKSCTAPPPQDAGSGGTCSHGICSSGLPLVVSCDPCATQVCAQDPYCCGTAWDGTCVNEVTSICGQSCK